MKTNNNKNTVEALAIAAKTSPNSIAGAIASVINEKENVNVELCCIGAAAVNQAVKGIAIARGFLTPTGKDIAGVPSFFTTSINGEQRTGIKFYIKEI